MNIGLVWGMGMGALDGLEEGGVPSPSPSSGVGLTPAAVPRAASGGAREDVMGGGQEAGGCDDAHGLAWGRCGPEDDGTVGWCCVHRFFLRITVRP